MHVLVTLHPADKLFADLGLDMLRPFYQQHYKQSGDQVLRVSRNQFTACNSSALPTSLSCCVSELWFCGAKQMVKLVPFKNMYLFWHSCDLHHLRGQHGSFVYRS